THFSHQPVGLADRMICDISLAEAPIKGKNIFEYSKNSNGAKDYMALAQEVLKLK
ncbi:MAG: ParA family protein, partial [Phocaeicola massiliensis]